MTRVVAGSARGRSLLVPPRGTRPTSDRVREALFSSLEHDLGGWSGVRVLDLYAGSGALGIEAASRGADRVVLVERDRRAADVARRNRAVVPDRDVEVVVSDVGRLVASPPGDGVPAPFHLVLADPPYDVPTATVTGVLADLLGNGWVAPGALLVVERATRSGPVEWPPGVVAQRDRRYGETALWYGRDEGSQRRDPRPGAGPG